VPEALAITFERYYWEYAWGEATNPAHPGYVPASAGYQLALGVNSKAARTQDQLHIHLATVRSDIVQNHLDNQAHIATTPAAWKDAIVPVPGRNPNTGVAQTNNYRALRVNTLSGKELFKLLYENVVTAKSEDMVQQAMVVTRSTKAGGGYFVLNTCEQNNDLKSGGYFGTNTCDCLLVYT
jgi:CDP-diacylglycerol pyrophosphatase